MALKFALPYYNMIITFCVYDSFGYYMPSTVSSQPNFVLDGSYCFETVNPCFVRSNNIYAIFLIEFGKHFSNCLAVFTRYRFNLSQYLFFFFADPYLIKSLSLVVTVKILLSAVAMAPSCHRYRTMASSLCRIIAFIALYCFALASSSPRYLIIAPSLQHHRCKHEPHDSIRIPYILKSNKLCPTIICITMCLHSSSAYQSY